MTAPTLTSPADELYADQPWKVADAAEKLAKQKISYDKTWIVTVYDKFWRPIGELGDDMIQLAGTDPRNALPTATLTLKGDSPLRHEMMKCKDELIGITVETGGLRFPFYVDDFNYKYENGHWTGTCKLNGIWDILNYLVIWPDFLLPIQAQIFSHAIFFWAICTSIETMVSEQALRLQVGLNEFINNALSLNPDIRAWFGTLKQNHGNMFASLHTPIYVVRTNPFLDGSPLLVRTVRMETCGAVITDVTKAYGVDVRVDLWLPGDDQPDRWANLTQPTYVVTVKDRSQITGPTKTVADSVLRTLVDAGGAFFGEIGPLVRTVPGMDNAFTSPLLGVDYTPPWAILIAPEEGEKGSVVSCEIDFHTPKGWQHIIGGRSPKWLNDLMNATYAWIIDSISILIGFSGIPSNILEGFLNNAFLAFQLIEQYERRNAVGPYHPAMETFTATASSPYNIETLFGFINKIWDTRGYVSAKAVFRDGEVYKLGRDVFRGGLMSVVYDGRTRIFTDYIENVVFMINKDVRDIFIQIGDGKAEESPLAKHQRFITGVFEAINVVTLAPQS